MSLIVFGPVMHGLPDNMPLLPLGYRYINRHNEWLIAEADNGRRYFVGEGMLYRQGFCMFTGAYYIDERETIELPQRQLT